jgi:hypothetical protein
MTIPPIIPEDAYMASLFSLCYSISSDVHAGQLYGDQPYFEAHVWPLSEFFAMRGMWEEACLALLHDVIEDHPNKVTFDWMSMMGIPDELLAALRCITKLRGEVYLTYLERVMSNEISWRVKLRDVLANASAPGTTRQRLLKYARALQILVPNAPDNVLT